MSNTVYVTILFEFLAIFHKCHTAVISETEMEEFLIHQYEKEASALCTKEMNAKWDYQTDFRNIQKMQLTMNVSRENAAIKKTYWDKYFKNIRDADYQSNKIRRQVKLSKVMVDAAMDKEQLTEYSDVVTTMIQMYYSAKICPYMKPDCNLAKEGLSLDPKINNIFVKSADYDELSYMWKAWRDNFGLRIKELYQTYVKLSNRAAVSNGFKNNGELWKYFYDSPKLAEEVDKIWKKVEPLYTELHKYVGYKLQEKFGKKLDISDGNIPAHVFGNLWAHSWEELAPLMTPFPKTEQIDVTKALKENQYTVLKMFQTADEFYTSMGLLAGYMSYDVGNGAMIEKPNGRRVMCEPSAWDFCDGKTYRIKMCAKITHQDFKTIYHEMGHIQYFLQYANQPFAFRKGANPGFPEAVGDAIALAAFTPGHLTAIGLLKDFKETNETSINYLMSVALSKVPSLPYSLMIDKWRWDVFSNKIKAKKWNTKWWSYRQKYQKIKSPVPRRTKCDFDAGAAYHVVADKPHIGFFIGYILQFQFYKSLCIEAGEYDPVRQVPLHQCDFHQSTAAGTKLRDGLVLGSSKNWREVLYAITGQKELDPSALLEYFKPLYEFLKKENPKLKRRKLFRSSTTVTRDPFKLISVLSLYTILSIT